MDPELQSSINLAVERLVEALKPERVYLFGSCAHGVPGPTSDVDLLVVVADEADDVIENTRRAYKATRHLPRAKDIIVDRSSVFRKRAAWASSIEREVVEKGKLLYG